MIPMTTAVMAILRAEAAASSAAAISPRRAALRALKIMRRYKVCLCVREREREIDRDRASEAVSRSITLSIAAKNT